MFKLSFIATVRDGGRSRGSDGHLLASQLQSRLGIYPVDPGPNAKPLFTFGHSRTFPFLILWSTPAPPMAIYPLVAAAVAVA